MILNLGSAIFNAETASGGGLLPGVLKWDRGKDIDSILMIVIPY